MEINIILDYKSRKSLLDSLSHEFGTSEMEEKLITLASLNYFGLLETFILDYEKNHQYVTHVLHNLKPTLILLIIFTRFGKYRNVKEFDEFSLKELINILKIELSENIAVNFSMNKLIDSFLNEELDEFKHQNKFFRTNILSDISKEIEERDIRDSKQYHEKYIHLYDFLNRLLIKDYRESNYKGYIIDMGMDYQTQRVVKYYLNKPCKENYFRAIKYAIKILYFDMEPYH